MSIEHDSDGYDIVFAKDDIVFAKDDDDLIESIVAKYSLEHLCQWAWGILSTRARDMPLMVAEDPSVLHVVAAYVRVLEASQKRGEP